MYLECHCKKIYVSPTSNVKSNCGAFSHKCKTFDDAVKVSLNDDDQTNVIILDGGTIERIIYSVRSHNIVYSKNLLIKGDPNSKFYPVLKNLGGVSQDNYLFFINKDNINISIQSVHMDNVAFVNTNKSRNLNVTVNDCYAKLKLGRNFISVAQNDKSVNIHFMDSSFIGDFKSEHRVVLTTSMAKESSIIQFKNCFFEHAYIKILNSSHVGIENCVFINTVIHFSQSDYLNIANSIFKNYFQTNTPYFSLKISKSNATVKNCSFFNNTNYRILASKSTLHMIKLYFHNNRGTESTNLILSEFSIITLLKLEIRSTSFYSSLIKSKGCKMEMRDSVVRNTANHFIITANNNDSPTANELGTAGNSLIILNTTISGNYIRSIISGNIDGVFKILYCSIHNNNLRGKYNLGVALFSKHQLNISHTAITFNSVTVLILCHGDIYAYHTRFTSNRVSGGIAAVSIHLKFSKFEENIINGSLAFIIKSKLQNFSTVSSAFEDLTISRNIIGKDVIKAKSKSQQNNIRIEGLQVIHNSFRSCFAISGGFTNISSSLVVENKASGLGKLITFRTLPTTSPETGLELKNVFSSFNSSDPETAYLHVNMVSQSLSLRNLTLDLLETNGVVILPVIIFERNKVIPVNISERNKINRHIELDINIKCPYNYYPNSASYYFNSKFSYQLSCNSCARGLYSFKRGVTSLTGVDLTEEWRFYKCPRLLIKNILETEKSFSCHACPAGGICESTIRSRGNFYGYVNKNSMLQFVPCPEHYCCSKKGVECVSYNTCNSHRTGRICGACMEGYFISYFSNKCIPISKCTRATRFIFWVSFIIASLIFTTVLCFTKDIVVLCTKGILLLKKKICREKQELENCLSKLDHCGPVSEPNSKQTQTKLPKEISYSAIFNVLVSFYQLRSLLQVPADDKGDSSYISAVSDFFNLNIMIQTTDKYCPTRDTDAVYRDFLKNFLLPVFMISITLIALSIKNIFRFTRKHIFGGINQCESKSQRKSLPLRKRLYVGFYVVVAFSYQKLSTFAFRLIHCVKINSENVLYIAGETKCYNTWQVLDMLFLAYWVIPFPASVSCAYHLLKKDKINIRVFMLCIILPPAAPLIYILIKRFHISIKVRNCKHEEDIKTKFSERFEVPYRKNYFWWESWTLYERLIVGFLTTFLVDPVIRLFALTPALLLFLWIHIRAKPYKYTKRLLYQVDMASYICLSLSLVINILRAVVYIYSLPSQHPVDLVLPVSTYLEHFFTPVWVLIIRFFVSLIRTKSEKVFQPTFPYSKLTEETSSKCGQSAPN